MGLRVVQCFLPDSSEELGLVSGPACTWMILQDGWKSAGSPDVFDLYLGAEQHLISQNPYSCIRTALGLSVWGELEGLEQEILWETLSWQEWLQICPQGSWHWLHAAHSNHSVFLQEHSKSGVRMALINKIIRGLHSVASELIGIRRSVNNRNVVCTDMFFLFSFGAF